MADILVVDDDELVLTAIGRLLEDLGHAVTMVSSGREALDLIAQQPPDLVILDVIMPDMDGLEVCRILRADPALANLLVLFLTAKAQQDDVTLGLEAGANAYLIKPFDVEELLKWVNALL